MRIVFTGGGTGGHFYPIIAIAEELKNLHEEEKLVGAELYFFSDDPYNKNLLFEKGISFVRIPAGKWRRYFSLKNYSDLFKTVAGICRALLKLYTVYPDVVFCKGGYASFPTVCAARILGIPVVVHESDSEPGRVNRWAGRFARRIALAYPDALEFFDKERTAVTGNPLRRSIVHPVRAGAFEFLELDPNIPTILVLGGSQGSQKINDMIIDIIADLLTRYQVLHQVGKKNYTEASSRAQLVLQNNPLKKRYKIYDYLNDAALRMAAGAAELVISRAGSALFEIAVWGLPAIIIPIPEEVSHDQLKNAYTYARFGAAEVIEEHNLTPTILSAEINRLIDNEELRTRMKEGAKSFARPDAARLIARELLNIAIEHEG